MIPRKHAKPTPIEKAPQASKRFLETINRLIERCDDIAVSTGCWLFIGAQHPGGVASTIHYTSPRLYRDAPERMNEIATEYDQLMGDLLASRRSDALELRSQLKQSKEENLKMEAKMGDMETRMLDLARKVQLYSERLGLSNE